MDETFDHRETIYDSPEKVRRNGRVNPLENIVARILLSFVSSSSLFETKAKARSIGGDCIKIAAESKLAFLQLEE